MAAFTFKDMAGRTIPVNPRHVVALEPITTEEEFEKMVQSVSALPDGDVKQQGMASLQAMQQLMQNGATASVITTGGMVWATITPFVELEQQLNSMLEDIR